MNLDKYRFYETQKQFMKIQASRFIHNKVEKRIENGRNWFEKRMVRTDGRNAFLLDLADHNVMAMIDHDVMNESNICVVFSMYIFHMLFNKYLRTRCADVPESQVYHVSLFCFGALHLFTDSSGIYSEFEGMNEIHNQKLIADGAE